MMTRNWLVRAGLLAAILLAASPLGVYAGKATTTATSLTVDIYNPVVDEQDTTSVGGCPGTVLPTDIPARFTGDLAAPGPTSVYGFGAPWTPFPSNTSQSIYSDNYVDGANCGPGGCLRAQLSSDAKTLVLDTRGTQLVSGVPRKLAVSFGALLSGGTTLPPATSVVEPMLLNVMLGSPFTSLVPCSSSACPEAKAGFAKLWFTDPSDSSVTWRVDWLTLRVLRMTADTWYILADSCDGTQVAGLSKLVGARTNPKDTGNAGKYLIPFFIQATLLKK